MIDRMRSRAVCAYCGAAARPNAMYCLECGQIARLPEPRPEQRTSRWTAAAHAEAVQHAPAAPAAPAAAGHPPTGQIWIPPAVHGPASAASAAPAPEAEHTIVVPPPAQTRHADREPRILLEFSTGERVEIHDAAVLGRNPRDTARNAGMEAIEVHDPGRSISRAHLTIQRSGAVAHVTELGSANGSEIEHEGRRLALSSDRRYLLQSGDLLRMGDLLARVTIV